MLTGTRIGHLGLMVAQPDEVASLGRPLLALDRELCFGPERLKRGCVRFQGKLQARGRYLQIAVPGGGVQTPQRCRALSGTIERIEFFRILRVSSVHVRAGAQHAGTDSSESAALEGSP